MLLSLARRIVPLAALAVLSACILVDDFGPRWEEGKPDRCLTKIAESLYYTEFRRDPQGKDFEQLAHAISLQGQNFLLLKKEPLDKGGRLYRFEVKNGIFMRYRLNPTMRETFENDHPNAPVDLSRDTVTLAALTPETEALLLAISAKPEYWDVEEKTLYNPLRNPACRFEDRDLKTLDK